MKRKAPNGYQHSRRLSHRARSLKPAVAPKPAPTAEAFDPKRLITGGSEYRKTLSMASGLLDYFPDALAEVSKVSWVGNMKHNPGQPMHHARGKSMDHADCIARHLVERGGYDIVMVDGQEHRIRHSGALAWRALALLQEELEHELGLPLPRGAKD